MDNKKVPIFLFYVMFFYSGIVKLRNFKKKVKNLTSNSFITNEFFAKIVMGFVIVLEIIGPILILSDKFAKKIQIMFMIFIVAISLLYETHTPWAKYKIPFLSNLTTFSGLLYMYLDS
jgi:uncharacterized membrane protein YphA (DoxX/SURF4 family)